MLLNGILYGKETKKNYNLSKFPPINPINALSTVSFEH